ncbi:MAG: diphthine--ammonia ligase [Nitrososphaeria archaeon]
MKVAVAWSGGKDSALTLYTILSQKIYNISCLLTSFTREYDRVTMHGVRRSLIIRQAKALEIPLYGIYIPAHSTMHEYSEIMGKAANKLKKEGVKAIAFGDIYLEDVRRYREENLAKADIKTIFPLWGKDPNIVARQFIELGFKAIIVCVSSKLLGKKFVGRQYDKNFLNSLPPNVDPCGERGEYHTFVYDGPIFKKKVEYQTGETVLRENFYYIDIY